MDDVLLAFRMNGQPRAGARISAAGDCAGTGMDGDKMAGARRGHGPSVQRLLSNGRLRFGEKGDTGATLVPITEMQVKAVIARPGSTNRLPPERPIEWRAQPGSRTRRFSGWS